MRSINYSETQRGTNSVFLAKEQSKKLWGYFLLTWQWILEPSVNLLHLRHSLYWVYMSDFFPGGDSKMVQCSDYCSKTYWSFEWHLVLGSDWMWHERLIVLWFLFQAFNDCCRGKSPTTFESCHSLEIQSMLRSKIWSVGVSRPIWAATTTSALVKLSVILPIWSTCGFSCQLSKFTVTAA